MAERRTTAEAPARREAESGTPAVLVESERRDGTALVLTLARPEARNSLSEAMLAALQGAIDAASADAGVRAVVIAGKGPAFCAGHDLRELTRHRSDPDGGRAFTERLMRACSDLMQSIVRCPKPVIAAVEGVATAAGCQLVATCDLAVASEAARFATPGVNIGLFCSTPMVALSRNVPRKRAMEMLLLGEMLSAREAAEYGLVNRVVPPGSRARDGAGAGPDCCIKATGYARNRQGGILSPGGDGARRGLRLCRRRHGREHDAC